MLRNKFIALGIVSTLIFSTSFSNISFANQLNQESFKNFEKSLQKNEVKILKDNEDFRIAQSQDDKNIVKVTYNKKTGLTNIDIFSKLTKKVENHNNLNKEDLKGFWGCVTGKVGSTLVEGLAGAGIGGGLGALLPDPFTTLGGLVAGAVIGGLGGAANGVTDNCLKTFNLKAILKYIKL